MKKFPTNTIWSLLVLLLLLPMNVLAGLSEEEIGVAVGDTHDAILLPNAIRKQLVFFAGPDRSSEENIENFLHHYAPSGWQKGHPNTLALEYWRWPNPDDAKYGEHVFDHLVLDYDDATLRNDILNGIKDKWDESSNGVILGSTYFDQVGPSSRYNAMTAMTNVLETLDNLPVGNVTVILNYRTPRLEQWISLWKNSAEEDSSNSYQKFMCDSHDNIDLRRMRISQIDASMNALNAAYEFIKVGYHVKLIDLEGVHEQNKDVTSVIGCDILLGKCKKGLLTTNDHVTAPQDEDIPTYLEDIGQVESDKVEKLFLYRDCGYKKLLDKYIKSGQLDIMYENNIWSNCDAKKDESLYDNLVNTRDLAYQALLSQLDCPGIDDTSSSSSSQQQLTSIDEALGIGKYENRHGSNKNQVSAGLGGFFSNVLVPLGLISAVFYAMYVGYQRSKNNKNTTTSRIIREAELGETNLAASHRQYQDEGVDSKDKTSLSLIT